MTDLLLAFGCLTFPVAIALLIAGDVSLWLRGTTREHIGVGDSEVHTPPHSRDLGGLTAADADSPFDWEDPAA